MTCTSLTNVLNTVAGMSDADSDTSTVVSLPPEKPQPTPEQLAKSEEIKAQANKKFQESHLKEAIDLYTEAIELNQRNHVLYANRAFCHVKLENYGLPLPSFPAMPFPLASFLHFISFPSACSSSPVLPLSFATDACCDQEVPSSTPPRRSRWIPRTSR